MFEIRRILPDDPEYPPELREIPQAPKQLFVAGAPLGRETRIAIVGTRRYSAYGKQVALQFAGELAQAGLAIVSGLAPGIDSFAHQATVEQGKRTIAVIGSGLDAKHLYPKQNLKLAKRIVETGGTLVSEYKPETPGSKYTFPERNRIISALSTAVLVVEAKLKSGSLITAQYALKHKKILFAAPGPIYSSNSKGTHYAIQKLGAKLAHSPQDILDELGMAGISSHEDTSDLPPEYQQILRAIENQALTVDQIVETTGLRPAQAFGAISLLEMEGKIKNIGGAFVKAI